MPRLTPAFDALAAVSAAVDPAVHHEVRRLRIDVADEKQKGQVELQGSLGRLEERARQSSVPPRLTKFSSSRNPASPIPPAYCGGEERSLRP